MTHSRTASHTATLALEVIEKYLDLQRARSVQVGQYVGEVLLAYIERKQADAERNRLSSFQFNPLQSIPITEPTHSRVIGDLLNPNGSHGQGDCFLQEFLRLIGNGNPEPGSWHISVETGRVDICLWRVDPASVVIIENKSNWAIDQQQQLYRYWYWNIHRSYPELDYSDPSTGRDFQVVYLTPSAEKRPSEQSLTRPVDLEGDQSLPESLPLEPIIFTLDSHMPRWFDCCIQKLQPANERLRNFLLLYQEIWKQTR